MENIKVLFFILILLSKLYRVLLWLNLSVMTVWSYKLSTKYKN